MKYYVRLGLLFLVALGCVLLLALPIRGQTPPAVSPATPPLSRLRLNPQQLITSLNQENVADAIQQLEVGWKQQFDDYHQGYLSSQLLSPTQIAQSLRQNAALTRSRSALVYAIALPDQLVVILLLPNGQLMHHQNKSAPVDLVLETTHRLQSGLVNVRTPARDYLLPAQQLYQWLITPLKPALDQQQIDNLIFCLGQGLRSVPMAALHDGRQFLIEQYSVSMIPAFNLLDRQPSRLSGARVLAMGASEFREQDDLPAVPLELSAIAELWQGKSLLNSQFTLAQLQEQRSLYPFGIIHLATHAVVAPGSIRNSYIQFWDQPLRLDQLREMNLQRPIVQLLVLSACRTAVGDVSAELGFAGLAVQSGAKAALASLWSVSDAATAILMVDFYKTLKTTPAKAAALRQTQLAMVQKRLHAESSSIQQTLRDLPVSTDVIESVGIDLSHPYYWAGFTLIGNPW